MATTNIGDLQNAAAQRLRTAWRDSTGDVPTVPAKAAAAPASQAALRTDSICDGSRRVAEQSRQLFLSSKGFSP